MYRNNKGILKMNRPVTVDSYDSSVRYPPKKAAPPQSAPRFPFPIALYY